MTPTAQAASSRFRDLTTGIPDAWGSEASWKKAGLVGFASGVALISLVFGLLHTRLFTVDRIDVVGLSQLQRGDVLAAAKLRVGTPMVSIDESAIRARLMAQPAVAGARVSTSWPHVVRVQITERQAVLLAQTAGNQWARIGADGKVISVGNGPALGLPVGLGIQAPGVPGSTLDQGAANLVQVAGALPDSLRARVVQIRHDQDGIRLGLNSGTVVIVGDVEDLGDKLLAAASVMSHVDPKTIGTLDVRSPKLPVATPPTNVAINSGANAPSTTASGNASTGARTATTPTTATSAKQTKAPTKTQ